MEAAAGSDSIHILCIGTDEDAAPRHVRKWLETTPMEGLDLITEFDGALEEGLLRLEEGEVDLLAISASVWYERNAARDTRVATALPRREENHILVADDRPAYLPFKSIILSANRLQRRQLRRYRPDFRVMSPKAFADTVGRAEPPESGLALQAYLEDLRATKVINGYVSERHLFSAADVDARRHALMTDPRQGESVRFLPSPLQGLTLLIGRKAFPTTLSDRIGDFESETAWECEKILLDGIDVELRDRVGMVVRHRQIPSLLKQAEWQKDLLRSTSLLDPDGKLVDTGARIEVLLEAVGRNGTRTLLLERLLKRGAASTAVRLMLVEWDRMLQSVTMEHEEDVRLGAARPAFLDL